MLAQIQHKNMLDYTSNKLLNILAFSGGAGATITSFLADNLAAVMYWVVGGGVIIVIKWMKNRQDMRHKEEKHQLEMRLMSAQIDNQISSLKDESS